LVSLQPIMKEVPYRFRDRKNGESKLDGQSILDFGRLVARLRRTAASEARSIPQPGGRKHPDRET
jgi:hypothetical protein